MFWGRAGLTRCPWFGISADVSMHMEVDIPTALSHSSLKLGLRYQLQYGINQWENEKHWDFLGTG